MQRPLDTQTQLAAPDHTFDDRDRELLGNVREHGFHAWFVNGEQGGLPPFAHTVGFWLNLGHPDLIMFGLPHEVSAEVIWDAWNTIKRDGALPVAQPLEGIYPQAVYLMPMIDRARLDFMGSCRWFYRTDHFPALHLVWPDEKDRFPWEEGYARRYLSYQPDLSGGWRKALGLPETSDSPASAPGPVEDIRKPQAASWRVWLLLLPLLVVISVLVQCGKAMVAGP